jgi:hypothetical protein
MNTRFEHERRSLMRLKQRGFRAVLALLLLLPGAAWAGGVVTTCTEAALRAAMAGGGTVTFACDGTITLASTITNVSDTTLDGSGHKVTLSGGGSVRVLYVATSLTLIHLTISNGRTSDGTNGTWFYPATSTDGGPGVPGGGIYNATTLTLFDCVVTANRAGNGGRGWSSYGGSSPSSSGGPGGAGGGIYNAGTLTLSNCIVSGNSAGTGGTGGNPDSTYFLVGGKGGSGGGIYNTGTLRLDSSTVTGNSAGTGAGNPQRGPGADGGVGGGIWSGGNLTARNCTFSGNSAGAGGAGGYAQWPLTGGAGGAGGSVGAIYSGNMDLVNCTIASNQPGSGGPGGGNTGPSGAAGACGGVMAAGGTARLLNTIIALNTGNTPDVLGAFLSLGHNLIGVTNGSTGFSGGADRVGSIAAALNPTIGPLANNGGPTPTMALLPGSPAIDAADTAAAPVIDQRGAPRPVGPAADIGAYEYGWPAVLRITQSASNGLTILGSGNAGQPCRLLSSADTLNWVPVATNQIGSGGTVLFYDTCAPGSACRFYRLVTP